MLVFNICVKLWSILLSICCVISWVACYICVFTISIDDDWGYFWTGNDDNLLVNFYKTYFDFTNELCYYFWVCLWKCMYLPCFADSLILFCPISIELEEILLLLLPPKRLNDENEWVIPLPPELDNEKS